MREQFEKAVIERLKEGGFLEVEIRVECLPRDGEGYYDGSVNAYWHFYKQSRADLVVTLPKEGDMSGDGHFFDIGVEACRKAIEAAGVTVAGDK
jgi:hypothetical protein